MSPPCKRSDPLSGYHREVSSVINSFVGCNFAPSTFRPVLSAKERWSSSFASGVQGERRRGDCVYLFQRCSAHGTRRSCMCPPISTCRLFRSLRMSTRPGQFPPRSSPRWRRPGKHDGYLVVVRSQTAWPRRGPGSTGHPSRTLGRISGAGENHRGISLTSDRKLTPSPPPSPPPPLHPPHPTPPHTPPPPPPGTTVQELTTSVGWLSFCCLLSGCHVGCTRRR